jgi:pimeloyl-ACP methyl ester carboxylesterase
MFHRRLAAGMPARSLTVAPLRIIALMLLLLAACTTPDKPPIPRWFDSIQRLPVKTVVVDGHRIAYLDIGQGPPLILVHGFGGSLWQWEYQQASLSASHRVITLDMLGSGFSDKPDIGYTPEEIVKFFTGFMDAVGIPRATLIGNSMGGGLVIAMAVAHPERVNRVVLISGLPEQVRDKLSSTMLKRAVDSRMPIWLVSIGNWFTGRDVTRRVLSEMVHDQSLLTDTVIDRSHRNRQRGGLIRPLMTTVRNLPLWEDGYAKRISDIRQRTLIVWGTHDKIFSPDVGRDLHRRIAGSRFELVPDAGHIPQWERPDVVNPLLLDFLK